MKYILVLSGLGVLAASALVSPGAQAAEDSGLDLGLRLGYGIPLGSAAENGDLNDAVSGEVPIWIDAGYRFTPHIMAGLYFQYGFAFPSDNACPSPASCSGSDIRFGVQGQYRFTPEENMDPWLGLGFGYEWLNVSASYMGAEGSMTVHGWEFLHLQGGLDFKVADAFSIGPFLDLSFAEYMSLSADANAAGIGGGGSGDIRDKAVHEWLTIGVRGVYDP